MQVTTLKFPGGFTSAQTIRREVAHEISQLEISAAAGSPADPALAAFLLDAAQKTPGYVAPALPATQAIVSNGVKVNAVSVTGTGNFATFTVVSGVITAIVLSAS